MLFPVFDKSAAFSLACIFSVEGHELSGREIDLFAKANPYGFILFARNIDTPNQVVSLCDSLRSAVDRDCPILIDQEGGRVQRLRPPHWGLYKPMQYYGDLYKQNKEKAFAGLRIDTDRISKELVRNKISVNCAPVLDVLQPCTHEIIGDRAFDHDPEIVARLGLFVAERYLTSGIVPVIKHIPGHGRAVSDSHLDLPVVDASLEELKRVDFMPFSLAARSQWAQAIWAMSAHVIYSVIDPDHPASVSPRVIGEVIRGLIGFEGILVSDDLDMKALDAYGDVAQKCNATLQAGCDLALYCGGDFEKMQKIAENCPKLSAETVKRLQKADKVWEAAA